MEATMFAVQTAEVVVLGIVAFVTSILSAVAGLGGGVILLVAIAQFHAPAVAIPIQGCIQIVSNGSRSVFLRRSINWPIVARSSLLIVPASFLGVAVATSIPEDASRAVLGLFVLVVAWRPQILKWRGSKAIAPNAMIGVGALSGFLNSTVGASGPVTSPFFKLVTASHTAFVATAGASQVAAHASKIAAFGYDGFDFVEHAAVIGVGIVGVVAGSWVGSKLLARTEDRHLRLIFQVVLTALAARMLVQVVL